MTLALLLALVTLQPAEVEIETLEELVVTGQRPNTAPLDLPIAFFRRHCHDPLRRRREAAAPAASDPAWQPLGEEVREQLGIADPATLLVALTDHVRGHRLVLRIDRIARQDGLNERRCTLTVLGGDSHAGAQAGMAALFRGPGTDRHVGQPMGVPALPGWRQRAWTLMPGRDSSAWPAGGDPRRPGGSFLVVTDPSFYRRFDYVLGDLKIRAGDRPVSVMSLAVTSRRPLTPRR